MNYQSFFQKYQRKINELKEKLQALTQKEEKLEHLGPPPPHDHKKEMQEVKISLSMESLFKAALVVLAVMALVYMLQYIKSIIIIFLVALFLAASFNPGVDRLQRYHIPRWLGILLMYLIVLGVIVVLFTSLVPIIATQIGDLAVSVRDMIQRLLSGEGADPWFIARLRPLLNQVWQNVDQGEVISTITNTLREVASNLTNFAGNAIGAIFAVFNGLFNMVLVLIITFFMVVNNEHTSSFFYSLFPHRYTAYISSKTKEVSFRIGEWVRGQMFLALSMGVLTFVVFSIMGLKYALTLALVSAISEFIPYIGPLITFLAAALIALNQDPVLVLWLIPAYAVIQFIESNIMVPLIIGKSVGLNPLVVMFALMIGATLGVKIGDSFALGLVGMIIAVPVANIISIFVEDYTERNK